MGMTAYATLQTLQYRLTAETVDARPTGWEVSLHSGAPGTDGTANEITDANYVRQSIGFDVDVTNPALPFLANDALITFPAADAAFNVTHAVVWSTDGGDPEVSQRLQVDKSIAIGEAATFAVGEFTVGGNA